MRRSIEEALTAASEAMEIIKGRMDKLTLTEKVDVAARLRAVAKHAEAIDKSIKEDIAKECKGKTGTVMGTVFKAVRVWIDKTTFPVAVFKEAEPQLYDHYANKDGGNYQVNFEPR